MSQSRPTPQPWPMKWIAVTILLFIAVYTFLTLYFRKPGPGYRPYQDSKDRATVTRLLSAGYQRISATIDLPADHERSTLAIGASGSATIEEAPGGLPEELQTTLVEKPILPESFGEVKTPAEVNASFPYSSQFVCRVPNNQQMLAQTYVYLKENDLAIVADFERLGGELLTRTREPLVRLTVPARTLQPGTYHVLLVGAAHSKRWTLQVH